MTLNECLPKGEAVVGIVNFQGSVIVATSRGLYRIRPGSDKLEPVELVEAPKLGDEVELP